MIANDVYVFIGQVESINDGESLQAVSVHSSRAKAYAERARFLRENATGKVTLVGGGTVAIARPSRAEEESEGDSAVTATGWVFRRTVR